METWAIVVLVVGTNLGTALLWLLGIKKQLKHSDKRFGKEMETKREEDEHKRKWVVRSEPLLKLREELAVMAERFEDMVELAVQVAGGAVLSIEKADEDLKKAVEAWDKYFQSGKFYQAIHMQYNYELKKEAHEILLYYASGYREIWPFLSGGSDDEGINRGKEVIRRNAKRISAVQLRINELLEKL
jgi:hypothetical protein